MAVYYRIYTHVSGVTTTDVLGLGSRELILCYFYGPVHVVKKFVCVCMQEEGVDVMNRETAHER